MPPDAPKREHQITREDRDAVALPDTPTPPGAREAAEALKNNPNPDATPDDQSPDPKPDDRRYDA